MGRTSGSQAAADVNKPIFIGGGGEGYPVFGQDVTDALEPYIRMRPGGANDRQCLGGEAAMTWRYQIIVAGLLVASCDRSDYVIDLKRTHIEHVDRDGGNGYVVDKASADTMAKYGDVYVQGRTCPDAACPTIPVGSLVKYDQIPVKGGVRLNMATLSGTDAGNGHPSFWLDRVACFRLEAVQGFLGRTGRSDWNCSVTSGTG